MFGREVARPSERYEHSYAPVGHAVEQEAATNRMLCQGMLIVIPPALALWGAVFTFGTESSVNCRMYATNCAFLTISCITFVTSCSLRLCKGDPKFKNTAIAVNFLALIANITTVAIQASKCP